MEIDINYDARPGLRIIRRFIDGRLVWVRGFNGVGKTMAATMLVISSGGYKFDHKMEFESLREGLRSVDISIKIDADTKFVVKLLPKKWGLIEETLRIDNTTLGRFYLNDKEIQAGEFQKKFQAKIVKGNETLSTQIQEMIARNISLFQDWEKEAHSSVDSCRRYVEGLFRKLQLDRLVVLEEKRAELRRLEGAISNLESQRTKQSRVVRKLVALGELDRKIEYMQTHTIVELNVDLESTRSDLKKLEEYVDELSLERDNLRSKIRGEVTTRKQIYDQLLMRSRLLEEKATSRRIDLIKALQKLQVSVELAELDPKVVEIEIGRKQEEYKKEEEKYKKQREDTILKKALHETADVIKGYLVSDKEIYDEVIAEGYLQNVSQEIEITVDELRELVGNRASIVQKQLAKLNVEEVDLNLQKLDDLMKESESVRKVNKELKEYLGEMEHARKLIRNFEKEEGAAVQPDSKKIAELEDKIDKTRTQTFSNRNRVDEIGQRITQLNTMPPIGLLLQQRKELVSSVSRELSIDESTDLTTDFVKAQKEISNRLEYEFAELAGRQGKLNKEISMTCNNIERIANDLTKDDELNYLLDSIENATTPIKKLEIVRTRLRVFLDYVDKRILQDIKDIHLTLEQMLEFQKGKESIENYYAPDKGRILEEIFNQEFLINYSKQDYMNHVFSGFRKIVGFDLKNNEISLQDRDGKTSTRPVSAFSSGEKAFAFALAMISLFGQEIAPHKVLFLDEFGALLDFVKENALLDELEREIFHDRKIDKVIILLPVKTDLGIQIMELSRTMEMVDTEERSRIESVKKQLTEQADNLTKHGYYQYETPIDRQEDLR